MRKNMITAESNGYKIIVVDDEQGIVDSLSIFLKRSGYDFTGLTNPLEAIERVRNEHFDMMILDFRMDPIHGDEVVEEIWLELYSVNSKGEFDTEYRQKFVINEYRFPNLVAAPKYRRQWLIDLAKNIMPEI